MNGRRLAAAVLAVLSLAAGALALAPRRAFAKQAPVIVVRVGGDLSARAGQYIDVPVTVDLTGAPGRTLGAYRLRLLFDPAVLNYYGDLRPGDFADPLVNTDSSYSYGVLKFTALRPSGASGVVTLFVARFYVYSDVAPSNITLDVQELTEAGTFADLLPLAQVVNGTFCKSLGTWGDVDSDGAENSRDALVALSVVVGLAVDTTFTPSLADVDADGAVTSRDALIILSFAVGLPVTGFRVGLTAAGACATGSATTLVIVPDSLELQTGQRVNVLVQARDGAGRVVPSGTVTWTSSNTSIASFVNDYYPGIDARDPGVATLTAALGPGIRATIKVVVLARRRNWYVDVQRAYNVTTQVGSQAFPFAFIGDAMDEAFDGDTVHVAAGRYDERVSNYTSVVLLGDSLNRPIIDQRGSSYYYPYYSTISAGSAAAKMEIAHFVVRGGGIYVEGHDNIVRDVRIEMLGGTRPALEIYSQPFVPGAPPAGAASAASSGQRDLGEVLVDGVVIDGYANGYDGIVIDQADTAIVRNSSVARDSAGTYPYCYYPTAIGIYDVNASDVRNNVVTNAQCYGLDVEHDAGRAVISGNRVTSVAREGIYVAAPVVGLDHNVVRDIGTASNYVAQARGIHVVDLYNVDVDSVSSVGDSIINSDYYGFLIDSARVGIIDSLVVDGTGQDSSYNGDGVQVKNGRFTVSHSIVRNTGPEGSGISTCGQRAELRTRGNRISNLGGGGVVTFICYPYLDGPYTLISVQDSISATGDVGIYAQGTTYVQVDSADLTGQRIQYLGGVHVDNAQRLIVRDSKMRNWAIGVFTVGSARAEIRRNTMVADSTGVALRSLTDSATVVGNTIDSSAIHGIDVYIGTSARVDSNVVRVSGWNGIILSQMTGTAVVAGNTIDSTSREGVVLTNSAATRVRGNSIARSGLAGVYLAGLSDTALVTGNAISLSATDGINVTASPIRADSNSITSNVSSGLVFYSGGSGRVTRNRFQNNGSYGVAIDASGAPTFPSVANNTIQGNLRGGAGNFSYPSATMDADSNYWGDPLGPRCNFAVTGVDCSASVAGDSVLSPGITFTPFLTSPPSGVPAAPRALTQLASAPAPAAVATRTATGPRVGPTMPQAQQILAARQQAALRPPQSAPAPRTTPQRRPFPSAWQRGREPRPPRPPREPTTP